MDDQASIGDDFLAICVRRAIDCIGREYPNHPQTLLTERGDLQLPRVQTPAFFGCFDWHSAVHAHWLLVRMLRVQPDAGWAESARQTLRESLTETNLRAEHRYVSKPGREGFERPYGLAWLLRLAAELRSWPHHLAGSMTAALELLESLCRDRLAAWLPKLGRPIRTGEHSQTAFAMGLAYDWARLARDSEFSELLNDRARSFFANDRDLPIPFEPSGHDFLSPALAEADLLRRVMTTSKFSQWLAAALPLHLLERLEPVVPTDRTDGKLAHLDGLNLSRAWMLSAIAAALEPGTKRESLINKLAHRHRAAGQTALASNHYAGAHWLGTFFIYDATRELLEIPEKHQ